MHNHTNSSASAGFARWVRPRFGLKLLFVLIAVFGIGAAWLLQPQVTNDVTVDLTKYENYQRAGGVATPPGFATAADHCIRIQSPKIISDAMVASVQLKSFAEGQSKRPVEWIYDCVKVVPAGGDKVRINVVGDASDKKELQHLAKVLAECYLVFLGEVVDTSTGEITEAGEVTEQATGWTVNWQISSR